MRRGRRGLGKRVASWSTKGERMRIEVLKLTVGVTSQRLVGTDVVPWTSDGRRQEGQARVLLGLRRG